MEPIIFEFYLPNLANVMNVLLFMTGFVFIRTLWRSLPIVGG